MVPHQPLGYAGPPVVAMLLGPKKPLTDWSPIESMGAILPGRRRTPADGAMLMDAPLGRGASRDRQVDQFADMPPSTSNTVPEIYEASGEEMNTMAFASSSVVPLPRKGTVATSASLTSAVPVKRSSIAVSVGPGATAFTRMPEFPCSRATDLVSPSIANLLLT